MSELYDSERASALCLVADRTDRFGAAVGFRRGVPIKALLAGDVTPSSRGWLDELCSGLVRGPGLRSALAMLEDADGRAATALRAALCQALTERVLARHHGLLKEWLSATELRPPTAQQVTSYRGSLHLHDGAPTGEPKRLLCGMRAPANYPDGAVSRGFWAGHKTQQCTACAAAHDRLDEALRLDDIDDAPGQLLPRRLTNELGKHLGRELLDALQALPAPDVADADNLADDILDTHLAWVIGELLTDMRTGDRRWLVRLFSPKGLRELDKSLGKDTDDCVDFEDPDLHSRLVALWRDPFHKYRTKAQMVVRAAAA